MPIRFAILAGVSTDAQARDDRLSIPDQLKNCRAKIAQYDGIESAGPYIMDGYSRSGYDSLDVAMTEIPPLGEAIRAAHADQYDILIMDNFDRLGDLGVIVKTRFKKLRKQLHSTRQSGRLTPPDEYDPYASEEADIAMYVEGIIQSYRINKIRRGWNVGIPKRAENGLHPLTTAFGYRTRARNEPAEQIPAECDLVIKMKDWFLLGYTLQEICDRANRSKVKPRRAPLWTRTVVKRIVMNPYYAGITIFGKYKKDGNQRVPQPPSQWVRGQGKHTPLWDENTHYAILAEVERRDGLRSRAQTYALTGLLVCSSCGARMERHGTGRWIYLACRDPKSHVKFRYETALELVADKVVIELKARKKSLTLHADDLTIQKDITRLTARRKTIQEGFENGVYTALEAKKKIVSVETDIERLHQKRERAAQRLQQKQALLAFADQDLTRMRHWLINDDPTEVNRFLTSLCTSMKINAQGKIKINWRE